MFGRIARRYSLALYDEAKSKEERDRLSGDAELILNTIKSNRQLELFFKSPVVDKVKKSVIVKEIFGGKISRLMLNFLLLLIERQRGEHVVEILNDFQELKNEREGILTVDVTSAVELTDEEKAQVKSKIDGYTKLNSKPSFKVEPDLMGGFIVRVKDVILDASIRHQLEILRKRFKEGDISLN